MKKLIVICIQLAITINCLAQRSSADIANDSSGKPLYYSVSAPNSNSGLSLTIDKNTKWIKPQNIIPNQPLTNYVFMEGAKEIGLYISIPKDSVQYYRYSIIEDDRNWLVSDAVPNSASKPDLSEKLLEVGLGKFDVTNKKITVELKKITERNQISTTIIYNKAIKPAELFLTTFEVTSKNGERGVGMNNQKDGFKFKVYGAEEINGILISLKPSDLSFIYHIYLKNLKNGKTVHLANNWIYGYIGKYPYALIDVNYFSEPGDYEIDIVPQLSSGFNAKSFPEKARKIHFTVLKSAGVFSQKELILWGAAGLFVIAVVSGIFIYFLKRNNKQKLQAEQQKKDYAQMQLNAIRSQLNPHFMFNALSGIQNLMNKNEIDQANRYLSKFARLTRNILNNNNLISIAEEVALLNDYLQMEQLRFGFKYEITSDPRLDYANAEIPSMLLQPILENAIKHGIADLAENGIINIKIEQQNDDLVILISDNGIGFDTSQSSKGLGLSLTENRISLLNSIYKSTPITLHIKSIPLNTTATFIFSHWL